ncbi:hypothetical protein OE88DRAFT_1731208 [Heliocybe sulcata]|uniref:DH domain-containing protein n=1 Tax=Heliocybe sulcata TaxID=5364 RepID=A0A5C3NGC4_9AGAM|nr:hypothetical protein OE88DRAFT_1731208 [Heliocybe sulcata]
MEVLVSPSISPPPSPEKDGSSYAYTSASARCSSSSLLDRRLGPDSTASLKLSQSNPALSRAAGRSTYVTLRTNAAPRLPLRAPRKPPNPLAFTNPLTPILSPSITPILSPPITPATSSLASLSLGGASPRMGDDHASPSTTTAGMLGDAPAAPQGEDYLNKGKVSPVVPSAASPAIADLPTGELLVTPVTPSWNTIPPSPPPRLSDKTELGENAFRRRTAAKSSRRPASYARPDTSYSPKISPRRRASMPLMHMPMSKPVPTRPLTFPSPSSKPRTGSDHVSLAASVIALDHLRPTREGRASQDRGKSTSTSRARFHIPSDDEDEGDETRPRPWRQASDSGSSARSRIMHGVESSTEDQDRWERKVQEDAARRYHALLELLMTEVSYLRDLRALVTIYLHQFPTISTRIHLPSSGFMRTSPSPSFISSTFGSHSRSNSQSQLLSQPLAPPSAFPQNVPPGTSQPAAAGSNKENEKGKEKEKEKYKVNRVVSDADVELVARNARALLDFHERFVHELRTAMALFGMAEALDESADEVELHKAVEVAHTVIDEAIASVTTKFSYMADTSLFSIYETFCSKHPEATDLVRKIQQQHATEWDVFEQRCAQLVTHAHSQGWQAVDEHPVMFASGEEPPQVLSRRARRHSTSSVSLMGNATLSSGARNNTQLDVVQVVRSDPAAERGKRLTFMDYLIKPVQRICKYPLMLDQLKTHKSLWKHRPEKEPDADAAVEHATRAMREVAARVDEARRKRDVVIKSSLIASRILAWSVAHPSKETSPPGHLTPEFMVSLGTCMLAGSLDVMQYDVGNLASGGTVKVKYLGAFLYPGGYIILAKVGKGKVYEPRHWFSLAGFDVINVNEGDALLPSSFGLYRRDHYFELAAACEKEKEVWLAAIRESITLTPAWINEPLPSLQSDAGGAVSPQDNDTPDDAAFSRGHSRRGSVELSDETESYVPEPQIVADPPMNEELSTRPVPLMPASRRSSTTSVKALFAPVTSEATTLVRSTLAFRQNVERALLDVFSQTCLTIRFQAQTRDQELFQAPKSSSSRGMASPMGLAAKSGLSKRESVVVPRRKSFIDGAELAEMEVPIGAAVRKSTLSRAKSLAARRQAKKSLRILAPLPSRSIDGVEGPSSTAQDNADQMMDSPTPLSQCSSVGTSQAGSVLPSPAADPRSLTPEAGVDLVYPESGRGHEQNRQSEYLTVTESEWRPKRARSMVDNVRGLFYIRTNSPTLSVGPSSSYASQMYSAAEGDGAQDWTAPRPPSRLTRWWKGSLRRRVQSAPEVPRDGPDPSVEQPPMDSSATFRASTDTPDVPEEDAPAFSEATAVGGDTVVSPCDNRKPETKSHLPRRRLSIFSAFPNNSRRDTTPTSSPVDSSPRKSTKTVTFLHLLNPKTSAGS